MQEIFVFAPHSQSQLSTPLFTFSLWQLRGDNVFLSNFSATLPSYVPGGPLPWSVDHSLPWLYPHPPLLFEFPFRIQTHSILFRSKIPSCQVCVPWCVFIYTFWSTFTFSTHWNCDRIPRHPNNPLQRTFPNPCLIVLSVNVRVNLHLLMEAGNSTYFWREACFSLGWML